jgi:hypothetical protein
MHNLRHLVLPFLLTTTFALPPAQSQIPLLTHATTGASISPDLFFSLEELARLVDISYCVGLTGIHAPFSCLSRCSDFPTFSLIQSWNTGPLLSDSCGYIAYDHNPSAPRIVLAFRGTYSIANTIVDLSTIPQEYVPYLGENTTSSSFPNHVDTEVPCADCTVHSGFLQSWHHTRDAILPQLSEAVLEHPDYQIELVGHSLGGAVALLAGLEFAARGWNPRITTFGEPKVGNQAFVEHIDHEFVRGSNGEESMYRRVTHVDDPVVLLPPTEWGYMPHASELYITKPSLPPSFIDIMDCNGDTDQSCSAQADPTLSHDEILALAEEEGEEVRIRRGGSIIPNRYKLWRLFFSHRDYFWRLGVCMKGGDPFVTPPKYAMPGDDGESEMAGAEDL